MLNRALLRPGSHPFFRLLLPAIVIPVLVAFARFAFGNGGFLDHPIGLAMTASVEIGLLAIFLYASVLSLSRSDSQRARALAALALSHSDLELRVRERTAELGASNDALLGELAQRALVEAELRERDEEFRTIFEISTVGMAQTDPLGRYLRVNQKFCEITGYPPP